ncbi:MAG: flagellar export chaperone FlgN [Desulfuromonadales bacterium]|nr:flagellar export chaperone FlgN [Desulfuromonadales bacterium]
MTTQIKQVCECLGVLLDAFGKLKRMVLQEREDVISLNLEGLNIRRSELETFFAHVQNVSDRASQLIIAACDERGIAGKKWLSALVEVAPKPDRDQLLKLQKSIKEESRAVENALNVNRALLQDSLAFTNQTLHMFTSILKSSSSSTYGQQGRFMESAGQPRIICKEI